LLSRAVRNAERTPRQQISLYRFQVGSPASNMLGELIADPTGDALQLLAVLCGQVTDFPPPQHTLGAAGEHNTRQNYGQITAVVSALQRVVQAAERVLDDGRQQRLFAAKVPVQRRRADGYRIGDIAHRDVAVSLGAEEVGRRIDDQLTPVSRPRSSGRRSRQGLLLVGHYLKRFACRPDSNSVPADHV
jgi:hypothetical protein